MVDKGPTWIGDALDIDRINSYRHVKQRTNELMPGFLDFLGELWGDALISHRAFAAYGPDQAIMIVTNQATNDLCDLLSEIDESRGRAAMRSARSLIEHMINLYEIVSNPAACEQYLAHIAVTH